jgi:hypothetical protein
MKFKRFDNWGDVSVTTLYSAKATGHARSHVRAVRARTALLATFIVLGLAGCESGGNILGGNAGPQATLTPPPAGGSPTDAKALAKLSIEPIIGAPENVARDLQGALASSLDRNKISVASGPGGGGELSVRGYIVAAREKTGSKVSYIWDVTDQAGKRVHRVTGEEFAAGTGKDPWAAVSPQVVQSIADKTASQIASWLPGGASIPVASNTTPVDGAPNTQKVASTAMSAPATPAAPPAAAPANVAAATTPPAAGTASGPTTGSIAGPVTTLVPSVTGAPGDGSTSLTAAIQRELSNKGVALTSAPSPSTYKVEGKVAMGQGKDGKQPIKIDWTVLDPKGNKLGTVTQNNDVPQGSLDGPWGKTADAAAAAAAQGILKLLPQAKAAN